MSCKIDLWMFNSPLITFDSLFPKLMRHLENELPDLLYKNALKYYNIFERSKWLYLVVFMVTYTGLGLQTQEMVLENLCETNQLLVIL